MSRGSAVVYASQWGFPGSSGVKNYPLPMQETRVQSLGQRDPLEKEMATHAGILAWEIPWTGELGGLHPWVWGTLPGHWGSPWVWGTFPGHWGSPWKRPRVRAVAILLFQRGGAAGGWSSPRVRVPPRALSLCVSPCGTGTQHPAWAPRSSVLGSLRASLSQGDMDRLVLQVVRGGFLEEVAAEPLRRKGCLPQRGRRPPSSWNSLTS